MNILLHDSHSPHAANLANAFPQFQFFCPLWNVHFRPIPQNVTTISKDSAKSTFDVIIEDDFSLPFRHLSCGRKIFLHHNEHDGGDITKSNNLNRAMDWCDKMVVVSDHKRATMREIGLNPKVVTIELDFNVKEWSEIKASDSGIVGAWHNCMLKQHCDFFGEIVSGYPHLLIGNDNDSTGFTIYNPRTFDDLRKHAAKISVFVYPVIGEVFGLSPMEAMAAGIPVIIGNSPEPWAFCFNGWNCFISRNEALKSIGWIRERVQFLVENREERIKMGEAGRKSVTEYFRRLDTKSKWMKAFS